MGNHLQNMEILPWNAIHYEWIFNVWWMITRYRNSTFTSYQKARFQISLESFNRPLRESNSRRKQHPYGIRQRFVCLLLFLFNDGHVLQLRTVDGWYVGWMIYGGHMITGDECGPELLTFILWLRENPGKNLNQKIDSTGNQTRARCVRSNNVTPWPQLW